MIRPATIGDFPAFSKLCERFRAELSTYPDCPIDKPSVMQTFGRCVNDATKLALVAEHEGRLTGALLAITQELFWSTAQEATDLIFYNERPGSDGTHLARRYIRWAHRRPRVRVITLANSTGVQIERFEEFCETMGLVKVGSLHQMAVNQAISRRAAA